MCWVLLASRRSELLVTLNDSQLALLPTGEFCLTVCARDFFNATEGCDQVVIEKQVRRAVAWEGGADLAACCCCCRCGRVWGQEGGRQQRREEQAWPLQLLRGVEGRDESSRGGRRRHFCYTAQLLC